MADSQQNNQTTQQLANNSGANSGANSGSGKKTFSERFKDLKDKVFRTPEEKKHRLELKEKINDLLASSHPSRVTSLDDLNEKMARLAATLKDNGLVRDIRSRGAEKALERIRNLKPISPKDLGDIQTQIGQRATDNALEQKGLKKLPEPPLHEKISRTGVSLALTAATIGGVILVAPKFLNDIKFEYTKYYGDQTKVAKDVITDEINQATRGVLVNTSQLTCLKQAYIGAFTEAAQDPQNRISKDAFMVAFGAAVNQTVDANEACKRGVSGEKNLSASGYAVLQGSVTTAMGKIGVGSFLNQ